MKTYDATFIFATSLDEPELDKVCEAIRGEIERQGGSVEHQSSPVRRPFARPMKKATEGMFVDVRMSIDPAKVAKLSGRLKLNTDIYRVQILVSDGRPVGAEAEKLAAQKAAAEKAAEEAKAAPAAVAAGAGEERQDG